MLVQLASFYLELRGLAHDDPEDYSAWEGVMEPDSAADGGGSGGETGAGLAEGGLPGMDEKKRGKKRRRGIVHSQKLLCFF